MTEDLSEAAAIAGVGVLVVMAALTVLMLAVMLITRLAPGGKKAEREDMIENVQSESSDKETIAIMAAAVSLAMEAEKKQALTNQRASSVASGPQLTRWASAGRERLMRARRKPGGP